MLAIGLIVGYIFGFIIGIVFTIRMVGKSLTSLTERGIIMPGKNNLDKPRSFLLKRYKTNV